MKKLGLALGGGGARGCAHIGVLKALQEAGISVAYVAGTSMGAVVGGIFAAGYLDKLDAFLRKVKWTDVLAQFDPSVRGNGMFKGDKVEKLLLNFTQEKTFEACFIPFTCIATNLNTGEEVRMHSGSLAKAIRASISLPGIFDTVEFEHHTLLDGGMVNPLPINVVRAMGAEVVLAVDVSRQYIEEKKPVISEPSAIKTAAFEHRKMIDVLESSVFLMQKTITEKNLNEAPADLLLSLHLSAARLFDFHKAKELIEEGYHAAQKLVPQIKNLLE